jgi:hypothetical protein
MDRGDRNGGRNHGFSLGANHPAEFKFTGTLRLGRWAQLRIVVVLDTTVGRDHGRPKTSSWAHLRLPTREASIGFSS